ncbi:transmembrane protein 64 isoform X1 [Drosophila kikkawai]|uniref:Transmembrane protein 64 isoform X1 n=2 Tax=Drosophila kikkawai TaxID=30033 RepID=A0A6P4IAG9_DROKI|nr:transmembrane protein 64 [Drosophila kikkawai]
MTTMDYECNSSHANYFANIYVNNNGSTQKPDPATTAVSAQLIQGNSSSGLLETDIMVGANGQATPAPDPCSACLPTSEPCLTLDDDECDSFLISSSSSRRNVRSRMRNSCWVRAHAFVTRNWYLSCLVPASVLGALIFVGWISRDYARQLLFWIETQDSWMTFAVFMALFTLVSFPVVVGYFVLLITAGYLFGCLRGWLTVILGANLGIAVAHVSIRSIRHRIPVQKLIKNKTGLAILRVISGPKAFKVVLFTRLTPIPFGLQNLIFGISSVGTKDYHVATMLGLLPAQTINVYLGSTLRSMHEVLNDNETKLTGYISFVLEVICGVVLMFWVVQKARKELSETLISVDYNSDGKHTDIEV